MKQIILIQSVWLHFTPILFRRNKFHQTLIQKLSFLLHFTPYTLPHFYFCFFRLGKKITICLGVKYLELIAMARGSRYLIIQRQSFYYEPWYQHQAFMSKPF